MTPSDHDTKSESKEQGSAPSRIDIPGGVFSRPGQAPMAGRVPGAYPGAYPGAATFGAQSPSTANDPASGRKLYIGQGITLSGEIESCDHLVVEGTVEAALKGASVLEIAEAGAYYGTVDIDEATIAGRFEGDLTVRGRLTIKASGSIKGAITYKELAIEAGAALDGQVTPLDAKASASSRGNKVGKAKSTDFGAELPFEGKAVAAE
ncbi:MAG: polymer-forming cytoskeletal protein [Micavibrio aeruginosavorus]|uniref:Polymer-forming cytoskeletal protein n=1 Tax=Micavibrio aeruginosavorus TaxID=349221 RepID=A0A2W5PKD2_9BACT|nr:MAG: polymer-forming cytoskeletal protein [Micavibrio aeruginosavorus]